MEKLTRRGFQVKALGRPVIRPEIEWVYEGFTFLSRTRSSAGFGPSRISLADMVAFLDLSCVSDPQSRMDFAWLVSQMDIRLLEWTDNHGERQRDSPGRKD